VEGTRRSAEVDLPQEKREQVYAVGIIGTKMRAVVYRDG
jgi:hypothetical protein